MEFGVQGFGFWGSEFDVVGLGFRVEGSGVRVYDREWEPRTVLPAEGHAPRVRQCSVQG